MIRYYTIPPPKALEPYIRSFWVFEMDVSPGSSYVYRSLADGCAELVLHYKGSFEEIMGACHVSQSRLMLHAQSQRYRRFITNESFGIFGAYIYPFALKQLFRIPAIAFSNEMPALADIDRANAGLLEDQLMLCYDNSSRATILSDFFLKRITKHYESPDNIIHAVKGLIQGSPAITVSSLAEGHGLSTRQFERRFKEAAGFSPKLYMRIMRFQEVIKKYGHRDMSLTQLGYECGYYDQSHFIHDFKHFSGYHPKQYFDGKPEGSEYREA